MGPFGPKPSQSEEEYIARQEALVRYTLAVHKARQQERAQREAQARLHHMKCPKCGNDLESIVFRGVTVDKCFRCNGSWLDASELEQLAGHGGDLVRRIAEIFRR